MLGLGLAAQQPLDLVEELVQRAWLEQHAVGARLAGEVRETLLHVACECQHRNVAACADRT